MEPLLPTMVEKPSLIVVSVMLQVGEELAREEGLTVAR